MNATIGEVFAILSDVETMERQALRRGIEIRRTTPHQHAAVGMGWQAQFWFRGRSRTTEIVLSELTEPIRLVFDSRTGGLETRFEVELMELSRAHTRMSTTAVLTAQTLSARLLVQSMKLAKGRILRRYAVRMAQFARDVEERALRMR